MRLHEAATRFGRPLELAEGMDSTYQAQADGPPVSYGVTHGQQRGVHVACGCRDEREVVVVWYILLRERRTHAARARTQGGERATRR